MKPGAEEMGKYTEKLFHGRLSTFLLLNTAHVTFRVPIAVAAFCSK